VVVGLCEYNDAGQFNRLVELSAVFGLLFFSSFRVLYFLWIFILFFWVVDSNNPLYKGTCIEDFIVLDIQLICF